MIGCGTPLPYFMRPDGRKNEVEDKGMTYMAHTLVGICSAVYSILYYEIWGGADVLLLLPRIFFAFAIITLFTGELRLHTLAENQKKGIGLLILSSVLFCIVFTFVLYQVIVPLALIYAYAKLCKFTDTGNHNYDNYYI